MKPRGRWQIEPSGALARCSPQFLGTGALNPLRAATALVIGLVLVSAGASAGGLQISAAARAGAIVVEADDVPRDELLAELGRVQGFSVTRATATSSTRRFSGRIEGTLDEVLTRILRNDGFMIVRSEAEAGRITRIVLFESPLRSEMPAAPFAGVMPRPSAPFARPAPPNPTGASPSAAPEQPPGGARALNSWKPIPE